MTGPPAEACARCGTFAELEAFGAERFCAACAARPDVAVVEKYRQAHLGKLDALTWVVGLFAPGYLVAALGLLSARDFIDAALALCAAAAHGLFFAGLPWARPLPLVTTVLLLGATLVMRVWAGALFAVPLGLAAAAYGHPVTQLYFRVDVPDRRLRPVVERMQLNAFAHSAWVFSLVALVLPLLWPLAFVLTLRALATGGGRKLAVRALAVCALGPVVFCALFTGAYESLGWASV
ncbi:MAG: hypothetical protein JNK82_20060 [Myxococcaceae bacterium]|nr:hypothetical protein [Myxococcaceae bacterium]